MLRGKAKSCVNPLVLAIGLLVLTPLLDGCSRQGPTVVHSPSGEFSVFATIEEASLIQIHLADRKGVELDIVESGASDAMKWALGWMPREDVVILQSSDIGVQAYDIVDNHLVARTDAFKNESVRARAEELRSDKYQ